MRRTHFSTGEYYHLFNRGVDKRIIFTDTRDYERFLYLLFACNDSMPLLNSQFYYRGFASIVKYPRERDLLVDIICFCLMPNHFHLMIHERVENGISRFMQKLGTGYTMYFNTRHKRTGALLQGVFKSIHIDRQAYFLYLSCYIHANPSGITATLTKRKRQYERVKQYPWSSYGVYLGPHPYDPLLNKDLIQELSLTPRRYERSMRELLTAKFADQEAGRYFLE